MTYVIVSPITITYSHYFMAVAFDQVLLILQNIGNYYTLFLVNFKVDSCEQSHIHIFPLFLTSSYLLIHPTSIIFGVVLSHPCVINH